MITKWEAKPDASVQLEHYTIGELAPKIYPPSHFDEAEAYYAQFLREDLPKEEQRRRRAMLGQMWRTPLPLFEGLNEEFGFTLDAYADKFNCLCERYNSEEEPECHPWTDHHVFGNVPFKQAGARVKHAYEQALHNDVLSVLIVPASVNSRWHAEYAVHAEIRQPTRRIQFDPPPGIAPSTARGDVEILIFDPNALVKHRKGMSMCVFKCNPLTGQVI